MNIKIRLTLMSFLQFFVWGAWLITVGIYCGETKGWSPAEFGVIFGTLGISSIFMPALTGIVADKWMNAERLYGSLHIAGGLILCYIPQVDDLVTFYWVIFAAMLCYMPTISLSNSVAYTILKNNQYDVVKVFPPIRVWGTIGFIAAMWVTNLTGNKASANMFYISAAAAIALGIYSFTLPKCPPPRRISEKASFAEKLGLNAFKLFGTYKLAIFFLFSPCSLEQHCSLPICMATGTYPILKKFRYMPIHLLSGTPLSSCLFHRFLKHFLSWPFLFSSNGLVLK